MRDASSAPHVSCDALRPLSDMLRPETPLPDGSCTLRRTTSYASIDTLRPSSRGVRRRITEIADNLKNKSAKKKKKDASSHDTSKSASHDLAHDSKHLAGKATKRERKATAPLRDSSRRFEQSVLAIPDTLYTGVPSGQVLPMILLSCESNALADKPPVKEDDQPLKDCGFLIGCLDPGAKMTTEHQNTFQPRTSKIDIKDVQLGIQPSELNVTIWDGLQAAHHTFRCRLYLRCTTHPYDAVSLPDIHCVEMNCNTRPVGSRHARPPVLQTSYEGASPSSAKNPGGRSKAKSAAEIRMDLFWRTILDKDGTWGWYREAFVPLSSRLFDKTDYREFKLVSRVWMGENCVEAELTFGISMLLRGLDMK